MFEEIKAVIDEVIEAEDVEVIVAVIDEVFEEIEEVEFERHPCNHYGDVSEFHNTMVPRPVPRPVPNLDYFIIVSELSLTSPTVEPPLIWHHTDVRFVTVWACIRVGPSHSLV